MRKPDGFLEAFMKHEDQIEIEPRASAPPDGGEPSTPPPDLEELIRRHRQLDEQLQELAGVGHLSPLQQHEAAVMKKRKLALKDRIAALAASS
jgi:uncharacterized protein YdcH (DUF465 family)